MCRTSAARDVPPKPRTTTSNVKIMLFIFSSFLPVWEVKSQRIYQDKFTASASQLPRFCKRFSMTVKARVNIPETATQGSYSVYNLPKKVKRD
jgi:hypothetical protein